MTQTLIPMGKVRYAIRNVPYPGMEDTIKRVPFLQQAFRTTGGKTVWIDVPTVEDEETKK